MVRLIILAVLGLVLGLGGGSAFSVMKAKRAHAAQVAVSAKAVSDSLAKRQEAPAGPAPTDSTRPPGDSTTTKGDSAAAGATSTDSSHAKSPPTNGPPSAKAAAAAGTTTASHPASSGGKPPAWNRAVATIEAHGTPGTTDTSHAPHLPALPAKPIVPLTSATAPIAPERIAKLFAAMPAKDAAKVLEHLDNAEVQSILGWLKDRQAAANLQSFPSERAAAISRAALNGTSAKP